MAKKTVTPSQAAVIGGPVFSDAEVAAIKEMLAAVLDFDVVRPPFPAATESVLTKLGLLEGAEPDPSDALASAMRPPLRMH